VTAERIDPDTALGAIRLRVADVERAEAFYERAIGLAAVERSSDAVRLGPRGGVPLVELAPSPGAPPRPPRSSGLFHLALLVPSRLELARALRRVVQAGRHLTGASDHLVSEALYLRDPEGNGIEIYRDRPREEWRHVDGVLEMATLPLDLDGLMAELPAADAGADGVPPETVLGHVHLQVSDLAAAEAFYHRTLGFDVTVRTYPGALFLSAGGYHHHIGVNTWAGEGVPAPQPGSLGLSRFEVVLPSPDSLARVAGRLAAAGLPVHDRDGGIEVADPSGNDVLLRAR
jgi:catechol 2,3-dioxygenase